ncbi:hypothetical protein [Adhaeribacter aquaticus]|uniref:hypothetical protein n=1 Tax=Adhaeribacter aquaticus TaxID=299567 RepID=UPI0004072F9F|nr:hypothetical protein [Adhaeribacter aquaticus]
MGTIRKGFNQFVFNGASIPLNSVSWGIAVKGIYRINLVRTGWESWQPGRTINAFGSLERDTFYLIEAYRDFTLPDAQIVVCATGAASADIPEGLSQFLFAGETTSLGSSLGNTTVLYTLNTSGTGWLSWMPTRPINAFNALVPGKFYFVNSSAPFSLAGAQNLACAETFGSENINGAQYVRYTDLDAELPEVPDLKRDSKRAPNMVLFRKYLQSPYWDKTQFIQETEDYELPDGSIVNDVPVNKLNPDFVTSIAGALKGTFEEINALKNASSLLVHRYYTVLDFQTIHFKTGTSEIVTGPTEEITLLATSSNSFAKQAWSSTYSNHYIEFDFNNQVCEDNITPRKGKIELRRDPVSGNEAEFDFLAVKHKLNPANVLDWNSGVTYGLGAVRRGSNGHIYASRKSGNIGNDPILSPDVGFTLGLAYSNEWWALIMVVTDNGGYCCFTGGGTARIGRYTFSNFTSDSLDFYTFNTTHNGILEKGNIGKIVNIKLGKNPSNNPYGGNIFIATDDGATIYENYLGDNSFNNIFWGSNINRNQFGKRANSNYFGSYSFNNNFGNDASGNVHPYGINDSGLRNNNFGNSIVNNSWGFDVANNNFGNSMSGNCFASRTISNTSGNFFNNNIARYNFNVNRFKDYCSGNTSGPNFLSNTYDLFQANTVGNGFEDNWGEDVYLNTFGDNCKYNHLNHIVGSAFANGFSRNVMKLVRANPINNQIQIQAQNVTGNNFGTHVRTLTISPGATFNDNQITVSISDKIITGSYVGYNISHKTTTGKLIGETVADSEGFPVTRTEIV